MKYTSYNENDLINIKQFKKIDFLLLFLIFLLTIIGLLMLYSAGAGNMKPWVVSQIKRFIVFLPVFFLIIFTNIRFIYRFSYYFYFLGLIILLYANFAGFSAMGAKRWINILGINFQPSEFMKIVLIIALARYFHNIHVYKVRNIWFLCFPLIITLIPVFLILKQPDLGTAFILFTTAITMFFISGVSIAKFVISFIFSVCSIPFLWSYLKDYQKQRVLTFLNPESDPLGAGYNIIQSKIAIGSGGLFGKGFLSGSQGQLNFLPERETDFIFTMVAEEFGYIGSLIVILIYSLIFYRSIMISLQSRSYFGKLLTVGLSFFLFMHFFINIAMVTGIIPVVGAPLPFISYGGTMLIITMISFALILNIDVHKDVYISRVEK